MSINQNKTRPKDAIPKQYLTVKQPIAAKILAEPGWHAVVVSCLPNGKPVRAREVHDGKRVTLERFLFVPVAAWGVTSSDGVVGALVPLNKRGKVIDSPIGLFEPGVTMLQAMRRLRHARSFEDALGLRYGPT